MMKKLFAVVAFIGATTASLTAQTFAYPDWWNKNNHFEEVEAYTESNMTMTVMGTIDGVRCDDAFEIGVFCSNGDCREVQPFFRYINQTLFGRFYFYSKLTINGSTGESFSFRLYDHRHNVDVADHALIRKLIIHWSRDCACTDDVADHTVITWLIMH